MLMDKYAIWYLLTSLELQREHLNMLYLYGTLNVSRRSSEFKTSSTSDDHDCSSLMMEFLPLRLITFTAWHAIRLRWNTTLQRKDLKKPIDCPIS